MREVYWMKAIGIIPARYASTRFPGKPLALIAGVPMIERVYRQVCQSEELERVIVATDHEEIKGVVESIGGEAILTSAAHETGSDRMAEVASNIEGDFFINIQGDEPLIQPTLINEMVRTSRKQQNRAVITAMKKINRPEDITDPNVVKVVTNEQNEALYFSRAPIPFQRGEKTDYFKHIGVYGYPREILMRFVMLPQTPLEQAEMLEQLRLIENNILIKMIATDDPFHGVDTKEDIQKIEEILGGKQYV